jgi:hypothetical protein
MTDQKRIKHGGRKKGTPNRLTKDIRLKLKDFVFNEIDNISDTINSVDNDKRLEFLIKLLSYVLPKVENVHYSENEPFNIDDYVY